MYNKEPNHRVIGAGVERHARWEGAREGRKEGGRKEGSEKEREGRSKRREGGRE